MKVSCRFIHDFSPKIVGAAFDSAEPFDPESFDPELTTDGLTAEGLVAGLPRLKSIEVNFLLREVFKEERKTRQHILV